MNPDTAPLSIDAAAKALKVDRRTLTAALEDAQRLDFIEPLDRDGVRQSPRWTLAQCCEALEMLAIRKARRDRRRWCKRLADDLDRALALPCPRCGGHHAEMPLLPMPGRQYSPEVTEWHRQHDFPERYPEAGPDMALF